MESEITVRDTKRNNEDRIELDVLSVSHCEKGNVHEYRVELGKLLPKDVHLFMNSDNAVIESITIKLTSQEEFTIGEQCTHVALDGLVTLSDIKYVFEPSSQMEKNALVIKTTVVSSSYDPLDQIWNSPWVEKIPILNIVKDAFEGLPEADHIKEAVDTAALISALLLTIASTLPFSMSYEDYESVLERYGDYYYDENRPGLDSDCPEITGKSLISDWNANLSDCYAITCSTFILSVIFILQFSVSELQDRLIFASWWVWAKYVILFMMIMIIISIVRLNISIWLYLRMQWPTCQDFGSPFDRTPNFSPDRFNTEIFWWCVVLTIFFGALWSAWKLVSSSCNKDQRSGTNQPVMIESPLRKGDHSL
jgi:hypothetical protein